MSRVLRACVWKAEMGRLGVRRTGTRCYRVQTRRRREARGSRTEVIARNATLDQRRRSCVSHPQRGQTHAAPDACSINVGHYKRGVVQCLSVRHHPIARRPGGQLQKRTRPRNPRLERMMQSILFPVTEFYLLVSTKQKRCRRFVMIIIGSA